MNVKYNPQKNLFEDSVKECILPQVMWHITNKCSLNCKMCFVKERKGTNVQDVNVDNIYDVLSLLKQLGVQKIDISGGEPLLYESLPFLTKCALDEGFFLTLTTRGMGLERNINWVQSNCGSYSRVIVSIDGGSDALCDNLAGYAGVFQVASSFCQSLIKSGCTNLRINTVVSKMLLNDAGEEKRAINFIKSLCPQEWCLIEPHPLNKRCTYDSLAVSSSEYTEFKNRITTSFLSDHTIVLYRENRLYSSYWALYPDNILAMLSGISTYNFQMELCDKNMPKIMDVIRSIEQRLP